MPLYTWRDEETGYEVEVFKQTFDQSSEPPLEEELPVEERGKTRRWLKLISRGIKVARGSSWQGSKGNWLVLIGACSLWLVQKYLVI